MKMSSIQSGVAMPPLEDARLQAAISRSAASWSSMATVAEDVEDDAGRGPLAEASAELASPDMSPRSARCTAGAAAARRAQAAPEAWLASAFPPSVDPTVGVDELVIVNGVPDEGLDAAMALPRGGEQ